MANVLRAGWSSRFVDVHMQTSNTIYAVYDCCINDDIPSWDVAFIEQRFGHGSICEQAMGDEKYFRSLSEAKHFVNDHFKSGAEYFSLKQSADPDNILHTIIDKITYLMA